MLELEDDEYNAIQQKNYAAAAEIRVKVDLLRQEIENLSVEPEPVEAEKVCDERNDPKTITQCLRIMYFMMQSKSVCILTPTLRTLMESLVLPCLNVNIYRLFILVFELILLTYFRCKITMITC